MSNAFIIARNTLKILFRKKINILTYIILPVVSVAVLASFIGNQNGKVNVGIYNRDKNGTLAKDFICSMGKQSRYKIVYIKKTNINRALTDQKVNCVVMIPAGFDQKVYDGTIKHINIKSIKGEDSTIWVKHYIDFYMENLMKISTASEGNREVFNNIYKSKGELKTENIEIKNRYMSNTLSEMGVGFVTMFMLMGASTVSGFILKEKRQRTYFRIFSAPVNSRTYTTGNFLAGMAVLLVQAALISFTLIKVLKMDVKVTGLELFFMLAIFAFVSSALGLAIVAFAQNSNQSAYIATVIIVPSSMISGCFWPVDIMPEFMQKLSYLFPQRWLIEGVKRVQETGNFSKAFPCMLIILGFAVVLFLISVVKIKLNRTVKNFV